VINKKIYKLYLYIVKMEQHKLNLIIAFLVGAIVGIMIKSNLKEGLESRKPQQPQQILVQRNYSQPQQPQQPMVQKNYSQPQQPQQPQQPIVQKNYSQPQMDQRKALQPSRPLAETR
jgi:hypothetical protein